MNFLTSNDLINTDSLEKENFQGLSKKICVLNWKGVRRRSGTALDTESRGSGFDPHWWHRVVSLSKMH